ncbi:Penicillin-binding protein 4* [Planctomycetes bacterium Poly30]|uniref:Penicillin-binding protein 4 n=1 Tax=Saltatorellus ferox TaxID=2528018 RepID=A0A518EKR4_9BACT|nr:Penicillin-binding protein 4* [Planctomycetes bacterium Poly30]
MLAALCLSILSSVVTRPLPPEPNSPAADKKALQAIEAYLERCEFFGWSGAILIEEKGRVVLHRGFGEADRAKGIPCEVDTVFEIASVTKPFTACAILALVEDGKIDLDESIAEYLPGVPEARKNITVRHLLSHTSGMGRSQGVTTGTDLEAAVESAFAEAPLQEPGIAYEYWNQGYALLAGLIDHVTEEGYLDFLRHRLFAKAELGATGFTGDDLWPLEKQAIGYSGDTPLRHAAEHPYGAYDYRYRGMGGIVTNVEELWKLARAALDGELLKKSTTRDMLKEDGVIGPLGWRIMRSVRGDRQIWHGGDVEGFHTTVDCYPDNDAAVVVFSSSTEVHSFKIARSVASLLLSDGREVQGPPAIVRWKSNVLAKCEGKYGDGQGITLVVRAVGPGLEVTGGDDGGKALLLRRADKDPAKEVVVPERVPRMRFAVADDSPAKGTSRSKVGKPSGDEVFRTHIWARYQATSIVPTLRFEPNMRSPETLILEIPDIGEYHLKKQSD